MRAPSRSAAQHRKARTARRLNAPSPTAKLAGESDLPSITFPSSITQNLGKRKEAHHDRDGSLRPLHTHTTTPIILPIFMIRALPVGTSPSNLAQKRETPHFTSRRFTGRHKRVSSGRHALRHYDHRFGEPWNGWKDCWKDLVEKKRRAKKQEFVGFF